MISLAARMSQPDRLVILGWQDLAGTLLHLHAQRLRENGIAVAVCGLAGQSASADAVAKALGGTLIFSNMGDGLRAAVDVINGAITRMGVPRERTIVASLTPVYILAARGLGLPCVSPSTLEDLIDLNSLGELWHDT